MSSISEDEVWYIHGYYMRLDEKRQAELVREEDHEVPPLQRSGEVLLRDEERGDRVPGVQRDEERTPVIHVNKLVRTRMFSKEEVEDAPYLDAIQDALMEDLMTPVIGSMVHVMFQDDDEMPCRAAIVTGIDYGSARPRQIFVAVFRSRGDLDRAVLTEQSMWHRPEDCTSKIPI
jgi:hypothetical protein